MRPALGLYIHIPWCVRKCPYCDFNSHSHDGQLPESDYIAALLDDLDEEWARSDGQRPISTIFIGGGTPSLMSGAAIARLLDGVRSRSWLAADAEITLEANPGTVEAERFAAYVAAGVNRISIGVQSFNDAQLAALGRIHQGDEAIAAAQLAARLPLASFNLDLMHGLPGQSVEAALADLRQAIALNPPHLSWYQLTLEPNTPFYRTPPTLPDDDVLADIQEAGHALLLAAGYEQYEVSAYARPGLQCRHNCNYWQYGDYLGIGCGAHGKLTSRSGDIIRTVKVRSPKAYLDHQRPRTEALNPVPAAERPFEFMLNRLRLFSPFTLAEFSALTGVDAAVIATPLASAIGQGLLQQQGASYQLTAHGRRYLNSALTLFLPE